MTEIDGGKMCKTAVEFEPFVLFDSNTWNKESHATNSQNCELVS